MPRVYDGRHHSKVSDHCYFMVNVRNTPELFRKDSTHRHPLKFASLFFLIKGRVLSFINEGTYG